MQSRAPQRGAGPRKRQQIFDATLRLLAERGYEGLTVEGVAELSSANKTTIYRWWPSKAALVGAALIEARALSLSYADTGSLRGDLEALVRAIAALLTKPPASSIAVAALGAAVHNPELAAAAKQFFAERLNREQPMFARARERGELEPDADPMLIIDLLGGAIWLRAVFRQLPIERDFARKLVSAVLDGTGTRKAARKAR